MNECMYVCMYVSLSCAGWLAVDGLCEGLQVFFELLFLPARSSKQIQGTYAPGDPLADCSELNTKNTQPLRFGNPVTPS